MTAAEKKLKMIDAMRQGRPASTACKLLRVSLATHYYWMRYDKTYAASVTAALNEFDNNYH